MSQFSLVTVFFEGTREYGIALQNAIYFYSISVAYISLIVPWLSPSNNIHTTGLGSCTSFCTFIFSTIGSATMTKPRFIGHEAQYICQDSKLLASVVYFAQLVETSLWAFWVGQHAPYTRFLPRPARKETNVP